MDIPLNSSGVFFSFIFIQGGKHEKNSIPHLGGPDDRNGMLFYRIRYRRDDRRSQVQLQRNQSRRS